MNSTASVSASPNRSLLDELDHVSKELLQNKEKLWKTQDELKEYNIRIQLLETSREKEHNTVQLLMDENSALLEDGRNWKKEMDFLKTELQEKHREMLRPDVERRLKKAVELLQDDLEKSKEKSRNSEQNVRTLTQKLEELGKSRVHEMLQEKFKRLESKVERDEHEKLACEDDLEESRKMTHSLAEEVSFLQEQLHKAKNIIAGRERSLEESVTNRVKEKLTQEVEQRVTKEVEQRVTKEVRVKMKQEREKEINALRDQFKKVFKENSILQERVSATEADVAGKKRLEEEIPELKYEISYLVETLENTKIDQEHALGELDAFFQMKVHAVREEAAKEKWVHASEIRQQMAREREFEINEFSDRLEVLARETDALLEQAERKKEEHGNQVRQRVNEEKQREFCVLQNRLKDFQQESEERLEQATEEKEAYAGQIRQQMMEEQKRETAKFNHRLEALSQEKEVLEKRIDGFDDELSNTWRENENKADELKTSHSALKTAEDEISKLKRKAVNLNTLLDRHKKEHAGVSKELADSKELFGRALSESETKTSKLSESSKTLDETLKELEGSRQESKEAADEFEHLSRLLEAYKSEHAQASKELIHFKTAFGTSGNEVSQLKEDTKDLNASLAKVRADYSETSKGIKRATAKSHEAEEEAYQLKEQIKHLNHLLDTYKSDHVETSKELERSTNFKDAYILSERKVSQLKGKLWSLNSILDKTKSEYSESAEDFELAKQKSREAENETTLLREKVKQLTHSLHAYKGEQVESSKTAGELGHSKEAHLKQHIHHLRRILETYEGDDISIKVDGSSEPIKAALAESEKEVNRLQEQVQKLLLLDKPKDAQSEPEEESPEYTKKQFQKVVIASEEGIVRLKGKIKSLESLLENSKEDHSQTSVKLVHSKRLFNEAMVKYEDTIFNLKKRGKELEKLFENKNSELSNELDECKHDLLRAFAEETSLREKMKSLEVLHNQSKRKNSDITATLHECRQQLHTSFEEEASLRERIESLEVLHNQSDSKNSDITTKLQQCRQQLQQASEEGVSLRETIKGLEDLLDQSKSKNSDISNELEQRKQQLQQASEEDACLRERAKGLESQIDRSKEASEEEERRLKEEESRLKETIETIKSSLVKSKESQGLDVDLVVTDTIPSESSAGVEEQVSVLQDVLDDDDSLSSQARQEEKQRQRWRAEVLLMIEEVETSLSSRRERSSVGKIAWFQDTRDETSAGENDVSPIYALQQSEKSRNTMNGRDVRDFEDSPYPILEEIGVSSLQSSSVDGTYGEARAETTTASRKKKSVSWKVPSRHLVTSGAHTSAERIRLRKNRPEAPHAADSPQEAWGALEATTTLDESKNNFEKDEQNYTSSKEVVESAEKSSIDPEQVNTESDASSAESSLPKSKLPEDDMRQFKNVLTADSSEILSYEESNTGGDSRDIDTTSVDDTTTRSESTVNTPDGELSRKQKLEEVADESRQTTSDGSEETRMETEASTVYTEASTVYTNEGVINNSNSKKEVASWKADSESLDPTLDEESEMFDIEQSPLESSYGDDLSLMEDRTMTSEITQSWSAVETSTGGIFTESNKDAGLATTLAGEEREVKYLDSREESSTYSDHLARCSNDQDAREGGKGESRAEAREDTSTAQAEGSSARNGRASPIASEEVSLEAVADAILSNFRFDGEEGQALFGTPFQRFTSRVEKAATIESSMPHIAKATYESDECREEIVLNMPLGETVEGRDAMLRSCSRDTDVPEDREELPEEQASLNHDNQEMDTSEDREEQSLEQHLKKIQVFDAAAEKMLLGKAAENLLNNFRLQQGVQETRTATATKKMDAQKSTERSGFQRSLERASKRKISRNELQRFSYRKSHMAAKKTGASSKSNEDTSISSSIESSERCESVMLAGEQKE
jgi:chromosome segregation ATPase